MTNWVANGITYELNDFLGYGLYDLVVAGTGDTLPRWVAAHVDFLSDASKMMVTTSLSSVLVGAGTKNFVMANALPFKSGAFVIVADTAAPTTNWMFGQVTGCVGTALTITVGASDYSGGGTLASWNIMASGIKGIPGSYSPGGTDVAVADGGTGASTASGARTNLGLVIGTDVEARNTHILKDNAAATLTVGFSATAPDAGTKTTGTFTPSTATGNLQHAVNGGAHTLAPPAGDCTMVIQYTNNGSAGAITTSGFTRVIGSFTTTSGDDFFCNIEVVNGFSLLNIIPLQ